MQKPIPKKLWRLDNFTWNLLVSALCIAVALPSMGMNEGTDDVSIQSHKIPQELYSEIFYILPGRDRISVMLTCKEWFAYFDLTSMKLFLAYFGSTEKDDGCSWKSLLRERFLAQSKINLAYLGINKRLATREGRYLVNAIAKHAEFADMNLSRGFFVRADLTRANLNRAKLKKAILKKSNLFEASLVSATLKKADLSFVVLTLANLSNANLDHATLCNTVLTKVNLSATSLTNAKIDHAYHHDDFLKEPVTLEWLQRKGAVWNPVNPPIVIND